MRIFSRPLALLLASAGFLAAAPARSGADMITYTETFTATGFLDGSIFLGKPVLLTFVGDTANITGPSAGLYQNIGGVATVTVDGVTDTFLQTSEAFDSQGIGTAGIGATAPIVSIQNAAFDSYDLTTSIGPVTGVAAAGFGSFFTSRGTFSLISITGDGTFQASLAPSVPEPASLLMMGLGLAGMAAARLSSARGPKSAA